MARALSPTWLMLLLIEANSGCNMQRCFNMERCKGELTAFIYEHKKCKSTEPCRVALHLRPGDVLPTALHGEPWRVTNDAKEACVFLYFGGRPPADKVLAEMPHFDIAGGPGMNHIWVSMGDWQTISPNKNVIQAWTSASKDGEHRFGDGGHGHYHRAHFDIAFPQLPRSVFDPLTCERWLQQLGYGQGCQSQSMKARHTGDHTSRTLLATFHGNIDTNRPLRRQLIRLHDPSQGFYVVQIQPGNTPEIDREDGDTWWKTMNRKVLARSKFILAPCGEGTGSSFRLSEVMSAGAVPVYIGDTMEPPFSETLSFKTYGVWVNPLAALVAALPAKLKGFATGCNGNNGCQWERKRQNTMWVYEHYFATDVRATAGILEVMGRRIRNLSGSRVEPVQGTYVSAAGWCKMQDLENVLEGRGHEAPLGGFPVDWGCSRLNSVTGVTLPKTTTAASSSSSTSSSPLGHRNVPGAAAPSVQQTRGGIFSTPSPSLAPGLTPSAIGVRLGRPVGGIIATEGLIWVCPCIALVILVLRSCGCHRSGQGASPASNSTSVCAVRPEDAPDPFGTRVDSSEGAHLRT